MPSHSSSSPAIAPHPRASPYDRRAADIVIVGRDAALVAHGLDITRGAASDSH